jgi:hypothetical protein
MNAGHSLSMLTVEVDATKHWPLRSPLGFGLNSRGAQFMEPKSPRWIWPSFILAVLIIAYAMLPPTALLHAAAMWGWG